MDGQKPCDITGCTKPARWKTWRAEKIAPKVLCDAHLADKIGKYALRIERLRAH